MDSPKLTEEKVFDLTTEITETLFPKGYEEFMKQFGYNGKTYTILLYQIPIVIRTFLQNEYEFNINKVSAIELQPFKKEHENGDFEFYWKYAIFFKDMTLEIYKFHLNFIVTSDKEND